MATDNPLARAWAAKYTRALVYLAAHARANGLSVAIVDCNPIKMGFRSLSDYVKELQPKVVGIGENHALYAHETYKTFRMVKEVSPSTYTVRCRSMAIPPSPF